MCRARWEFQLPATATWGSGLGPGAASVRERGASAQHGKEQRAVPAAMCIHNRDEWCQGSLFIFSLMGAVNFGGNKANL